MVQNPMLHFKHIIPIYNLPTHLIQFVLLDAQLDQI